MASCVAGASPVSAENLGSVGDDVGDDAEYEEIEVEEEVEVEEEIEVEIDDEDVEDVVNQKETEKILEASGQFLENDNRKGKRTCNSDLKSSPMLLSEDASQLNGSPIGNEKKQKASAAMDPKHVMPRSGPILKSKERCSGVEHGGSKKKKKVPCQFYARGCCIKGNSCRFLHIKDGLAKRDFSNEVHSKACIPPHKNIEDPNLSSLAMNMGFPLVPGFMDMGRTCIGNFLSSYDSLRDHHSSYRISTFGTRPNGDILDIVSDGNRLLGSSTINQPVSFNFTPWRQDLHSAHNISGTIGNYHDNLEPSFQRNSSAACLNFGSASQHHLSVDMEPKFPSYAWEPSIPFEPSHPVTRNLLMKEFPQSFKGTGIVEAGSRPNLSFSDQVSSAKDLNLRSDGSAGKGNFVDGVQTGETMGAQLLSTSCDNGSRVDKLNNELEVDALGKKDASNVGLKGENQSTQETEPLMYFKTALAEYVKDLVKPTWREGLMSKDAHKLIVKKSVDKVMSTLQPHHVPITDEAVKLYLSSSHSKLANLVEAYIERYGKS